MSGLFAYASSMATGVAQKSWSSCMIKIMLTLMSRAVEGEMRQEPANTPAPPRATKIANEGTEGWSGSRIGSTQNPSLTIAVRGCPSPGWGLSIINLNPLLSGRTLTMATYRSGTGGFGNRWSSCIISVIMLTLMSM